MIALVDQLFNFIAHRTGIEAKKIRFLAVGGFNTLMGLTVFPVLMLVSPFRAFHYMFALLLAQLICLTAAYVAYKLVVFRTKGSILAEFTRFSSFYLTSYAINWAALPAIVELGTVNPIFAQTGFMLVTVTLSFFWHDNVSFKQQKPDSVTANDEGEDE